MTTGCRTRSTVRVIIIIIMTVCVQQTDATHMQQLLPELQFYRRLPVIIFQLLARARRRTDCSVIIPRNSQACTYHYQLPTLMIQYLSGSLSPSSSPTPNFGARL